MCMVMLVALLISCRCLGGAHFGTKNQGLGAFLGFIIPVGVLLYITLGTDVFMRFLRGDALHLCCLLLCIWALVQILLGIFCLGYIACGHGVGCSCCGTGAESSRADEQ
eukprot:gnl/MRDRNA2_/MRDRNA2_55748_c0_seq3.p1 gnl/MRDRNA2_/MRDRNA2_55748_c0~~gnl/MRDRNA2_/MRDRNA2_55748_c0_seq3.p1  ORF type:complete len:109 (+),score=9.79 gnl/MRDRNA2_/MRDRNA2_55748_c0_seq3:64-390(+)